MCTAIQYNGNGTYFGRNFDFHKTFGEKIVLTPRKVKLSLIREGILKEHPAMIGTAITVSGTALYFDGMNEYGICAAALNFPDLSVYREAEDGKINVASFEVIPYVLSTCRNITDVYALLEKMNITNDSFSKSMPSTGLHWMFSDGKSSVILESMKDTVHVCEAETGVLTNPPEYSAHIQSFREQRDLPVWDYSSKSRFLKASQIREKYPVDSENGEVSLFRMLESVSVPKGSVVKDEGIHYTKYTSVCDTSRLIYYRLTYESLKVNSVNMKDMNLEGNCHIFCEG